MEDTHSMPKWRDWLWRNVIQNPRTIGGLLVVHVLLLIIARNMILAPDDWVNWDLIPFLNANSADSLWELLQRPEVHFRNPFTFPLYNCGAESVLSAVMFRVLGHISLYWSNAMVVLVYDLIFLGLFGKLVALLFPTVFSRNYVWILLAMSPVFLTFASLDAYNMQAFTVVLCGMCGAEHFLRRRFVNGAILIAIAFVFISQAYGFAFYMPGFVGAWLVWRLLLGSICGETSGVDPGRRRLTIGAGACAIYVCLWLLLANYLSRGNYLKWISPVHGPSGYTIASTWGSISQVPARAGFMLRQAFTPSLTVDHVPAGFAPSFLYLTLIITVLALLFTRKLPPKSFTQRSCRPRFGAAVRGVFEVGACSAIVVAGYLPSFINGSVKSQRTFYGDLFLMIIGCVLISRIGKRRYPPGKWLPALLALLVVASDVRYLRVVMSTDHSQYHQRMFDFDLADGRVRHDLIDAIQAMKKQVDHGRSLLVVNYWRGYSENTTDPGLFFGHFLRHFGQYKDSPSLVFPCKFAETRYGSPFPEVIGKPGAQSYCYTSPVSRVESALRNGRRVYIWQWTADHDASITAPSLPFPEQRLTKIEWSAKPTWHAQDMHFECYEVKPQ